MQIYLINWIFAAEIIQGRKLFRETTWGNTVFVLKTVLDENNCCLNENDCHLLNLLSLSKSSWTVSIILVWLRTQIWVKWVRQFYTKIGPFCAILGNHFGWHFDSHIDNGLQGLSNPVADMAKILTWKNKSFKNVSFGHHS